MSTSRKHRGLGVIKACSAFPGETACWGRSHQRKCYRKKLTACGKGGCVACSSPQQADGAATTPTVGKRSSRTRKKTPDFAAAGSGSGEKKPKYATNAAECEAKKNRKIKREQHEEKKEKRQDRGTCVS